MSHTFGGTVRLANAGQSTEDRQLSGSISGGAPRIIDVHGAPGADVAGLPLHRDSAKAVDSLTDPANHTTAPRFFYGWVIVAVMAAVGAITMAMGALNFGLFIKPMGDDLGIGRAAFGWAQSSRQVASAMTAPVVGPLIDRFGVRVLLSVAAVLCAAAMVGLAVVDASWQIIGLFALMGVVGMNGPGALVTSVPVTKWFVRKRAKAMAFTSLGVPLGGFLMVPLTQILIDEIGWRAAWAVLGILGAGVIVPLSLLFIRRQPEDLGLHPDGRTLNEEAPPMAGTRPTPAPVPYLEECSWTRAEAIRTGAFWKLVFVFGLVMLAMSSVAVHRIPSFMDRGLDAHLISYATALDAAAAGLSTFAMGMLMHRIPSRYIGALGFVLLAVASLLTIAAETHAVMFAAMITFGFGIGASMMLQNYLWAEYFGRRYQGSIRGAVTPITLLFGGAGPPIAGYVRDSTGSYDPVWYVAVGLMLLGALAIATTPPPQHPSIAPLAVAEAQ
jgi:OFA family oxalate/formate antiporter-like MFS transporter